MKIKFFRVILSILLLCTVLSSALTSCGYNDQPLPEYEYPPIIYTHTLSFMASSSQALHAIDDEQTIKSFIDMINNCKFKKDVIEKIEYDVFVNDYVHFNFNDEFGTRFIIHVSGDHLIVSDDYFLENFEFNADGSTNSIIIYRINGVDKNIMDPFIPNY